MPRPEPRKEAAISTIDSAAVIMRAVSAALHGEFVNVWDVNTWQQQALKFIAMGGKKAVISAVERVMATSGVDPALAARITTSMLATWAVSLYQDARGPYDTLIIGAPSGGIMHLATALEAPFLSQHFLISYKDPKPADDVETYLAHGNELAEPALRRNRDLAVINHYNPLHDRFMIKYVNHIRYKLLDLPEAYKAFIFQTLRPGGTIIFADCRYSWPMYFIGERHWFQVGGLGGVRARDFLDGRHPAIVALQETVDAEPRGNWGLKERTAFEMPESEWGALPPLHQRLAQFARENAYEFVALEGPHPEYFSSLAFRVWDKVLRRAGSEPQGVFLETFTQVAPAATRAAALLPVWLPRNSTDSLNFLHRMRREFRLNPELREKPVFWLPLPHFTESFDMAPWEAWLDALKGLDAHPLGMRPALYPADPLAFHAPRQALMEWVATHPSPVTERATLGMILEEARLLRRQPAETRDADRH
ncbi:MAG TPA: hypothetical protein PKH77_11140 [Anaerolineae bacterium]|nr:hypothetical protein [Anaerolineae bacterium]